jgi:plasmid stabilization system protein ParE
MAFHVETTGTAKRDLDAILTRLLSQEAGETGLRWFRGLEEAIKSLSTLPKRCKLAPENASVPFEMRQLLYGRKPHLYRILFTIDGDVVYVLHVRHGRRRHLSEPR